MELASRIGEDRFVPRGAYRALVAAIRKHEKALAEMPVAVVAAFDRSTRLLPFVFYDSHMFPPGAAAIAAAVHEAGFSRTRAVHQLWNPSFRPSAAAIDGRPLAMLCVSSMQIHAARAYALVRDAWTLGERRPFIIAGGPKAIYEPYHYWATPGGGLQPPPDVVVTGESFVLLELLSAVLAHRARSESLREGFERARLEGALAGIPGLVFLAPGASLEEPAVIDTGLQRLVPDFDETPSEAAALTLLEPPHRGAGLSPWPMNDAAVGRRLMIVSLRVTQGCKFRCSYCPIPAVNQKSWRWRHPESLVEAIRTIHDRYGIKYFFGADDNFFNRRDAAEEIFTGMARGTARGRPFREKIRFATEATQADTYKNRDLLPLAREAGLYAIWFGIEDLTASLVNKGQKPAMTIEVFRALRELKISPMAMLMFHEGQPFYTRGSLYGLANQVEFLRRAGAVTIQCTIHTPAVGTAEYEAAYESGRVLARLGSYVIPEARVDGSHAILLGGEAPWKRQAKLVGGYAAFYNPLNFVRALARDGSPLRRRRIGYQAAGMIATAWTAARMVPYALRLLTAKPACHTAPPPLDTIPVRHTDGAFPRQPRRAAASG